MTVTCVTLITMADIVIMYGGLVLWSSKNVYVCHMILMVTFLLCYPYHLNTLPLSLALYSFPNISKSIAFVSIILGALYHCFLQGRSTINVLNISYS